MEDCHVTTKQTMAHSQMLRSAYALNQDTALDNAVYVHFSNATTPYVNIGNFVYRALPHPDVIPGNVCMNAVQRRHARVYEVGMPVEVFDFHVPVDRDFTISRVTLEASWLKARGAPTELPDMTALVNHVRTHLLGDVLTFGQSVVIKMNDVHILLFDSN